MKCNVGGLDRTLRGVVGGAVVALGVILECGLVSLVGAVMIATAVWSFCPLYPLLGINTGCKND